MKNQFSTLSLGLILAGFNFTYAQTPQKLQPCNTYAAMEAHFAADPAARASYEAKQAQFQTDLRALNASRNANRIAAVEYTIPVVFHILHQGGPENISDADCIAALAQINRDYAREGADTSQIFKPFKLLYIDSDIKFMFAKKDPNGNCINGIVRHIDPKTVWYQSTANNSSYWTYTWDPTRYLNIYIVSSIVAQGVISGGEVAGYTYKPTTWPQGNAHDAIIFTYNTLLPNSPYYQPRALSHEIGHWLNLSHTFGNTNNPGTACGDDGINDTPVTKGNYNACPMSTTNTAITCAMNVNPYFQNVENIMDYSNCPKNFTTDQTNTMRSTLSVGLVGRNNVVSASNLSSSYTDVNGLGSCSPVADFLTTSGSYTICVGGSLTFKDYSSNGTTSRLWTADNGGVPASPTSSVTSITFNTLGTSNVTLTCTNAQGSGSIVKSVTVLDATASIQGLYTESFETGGLPSGWSLSNPENVGWQQTSMASYDGVNSFYIDGANSFGGNVDLLQMPMVNLLNNQGAIFTFAYSYARKNSTQNDVFKVQFSSDCGGSWTDVVTKSAAVMASEGGGGTTSTPYSPATPAEWKIVNVTTDFPNWYNFVNSPSVLIRYSFQEGDNGQGNNFFLDAINISGVTGINELAKRLNLSMYPNPTTGATNLQFILSDASSISVNVVDVLGKEVMTAAESNFAAGAHTIQINKDNTLSKGVYFVNVSVNGTKLSKKLVIN